MKHSPELFRCKERLLIAQTSRLSQQIYRDTFRHSTDVQSACLGFMQMKSLVCVARFPSLMPMKCMTMPRNSRKALGQVLAKESTSSLQSRVQASLKKEALRFREK